VKEEKVWKRRTKDEDEEEEVEIMDEDESAPHTSDLGSAIWGV